MSAEFSAEQHAEALAVISSFLSNQHAVNLAKDLAARVQHPQAECSSAVRNTPWPTAGTDPLGDDIILNTVFSYVGVGDYIYTAGVCRRWKGLYTSLSYKAFPTEDTKLKTAYRSAVVTTSRLRLAMHCGLVMTDLSSDADNFAHNVLDQSVDPIAVLTLSKCYDMQWSCDLCWYAVDRNKLETLKWLREHGCPWEEESVLMAAARRGDVLCLEWLSTQTSPWSAELKQQMLWHAGCWRKRPAAKWLRETQEAAWPVNLHGTLSIDNGPDTDDCWSAAVVKWALASGCTWSTTWSCQQLEPELYKCECEAGEHDDAVEYTGDDDDEEDYACDREQVQALFAWAHKNGCPCTCETAAAL
jgi:hypothetical protein